jgi:hypothetical protein
MGPLRPDALAAVRAFLRCGDLAAGFTHFHEAGDWRPQAGGSTFLGSSTFCFHLQPTA